MFIKEKINFIHYFVLSIANLVVTAFFIKNLKEILIFAALLVLIIINQFLLVYSAGIILNIIETANKNLKAAIFFIGKTLIIGFGFYYIAVNTPHLVLYAVSVYVFQLLILGVTLKKEIE